jgi:hypothetical protein
VYSEASVRVVSQTPKCKTRTFCRYCARDLEPRRRVQRFCQGPVSIRERGLQNEQGCPPGGEQPEIDLSPEQRPRHFPAERLGDAGGKHLNNNDLQSSNHHHALAVVSGQVLGKARQPHLRGELSEKVGALLIGISTNLMMQK